MYVILELQSRRVHVKHLTTLTSSDTSARPNKSTWNNTMSDSIQALLKTCQYVCHSSISVGMVRDSVSLTKREATNSANLAFKEIQTRP